MKTEEKLNELVKDIKSLVVGDAPNLDEAIGKVNELMKAFHAPTIMNEKPPLIDEICQSAYEFFNGKDISRLITKYKLDPDIDRDDFFEIVFDNGIGDIELIEASLEIEYPPEDYFTLVDFREKQEVFHIRIWDIKEHMENMPPI